MTEEKKNLHPDPTYVGWKFMGFVNQARTLSENDPNPVGHTDEEEPIVGMNNLCDYLGLSDYTVRKYMNKHGLPYHKPDKKVEAYPSEINAWCRDQAAATTGRESHDSAAKTAMVNNLGSDLIKFVEELTPTSPAKDHPTPPPDENVADKEPVGDQPPGDDTVALPKALILVINSMMWDYLEDQRVRGVLTSHVSYHALGDKFDAHKGEILREVHHIWSRPKPPGYSFSTDFNKIVVKHGDVLMSTLGLTPDHSFRDVESEKPVTETTEKCSERVCPLASQGPTVTVNQHLFQDMEAEIEKIRAENKYLKMKMDSQDKAIRESIDGKTISRIFSHLTDENIENDADRLKEISNTIKFWMREKY